MHGVCSVNHDRQRITDRNGGLGYIGVICEHLDPRADSRFQRIRKVAVIGRMGGEASAVSWSRSMSARPEIRRFRQPRGSPFHFNIDAVKFRFERKIETTT